MDEQIFCDRFCCFCLFCCIVTLAYIIITAIIYREDLTTPADPKPCVLCVVPFKVRSLHTLKIGEHVSMSGSTCRCRSTIHWSLYRHHTIITGILRIDDNGQSGEVLVKGFEGVEGDKGEGPKKGLKVQERAVEVHVVKDCLKAYHHLDCESQTSAEILNNLKQLAEEDFEYHIGVQNCEHFCFLVWTGIRYSRQVHRFVQACYMFLRIPLMGLVLIYGVLEHFVSSFTGYQLTPTTADKFATSVAYGSLAYYLLYNTMRFYGVRWSPYKKRKFHVSKETCKRHRMYFILKSIYKQLVLYVIVMTQVAIVKTFHHSSEDMVVFGFEWLLVCVAYLATCLACLYYVPRQMFRIVLHCIIFYRHPRMYIPLHFLK